MEVKDNTIELLVNKDTLEEAREKTFPFFKLMTYYKCAMMQVETKFNVLNEELSLQHDRNPINTIKSRLKTPQAMMEKLRRRGLPYGLKSVEENLNDVAGVRICCSFIEDVYMLEDAFLKQDDIVLVERKDYIANPKPNGYRSLHLIVAVPIYLKNEKRMMKVEIQLRTIAMDFWASVEHQLRYKKNHEFTEDMANELLSCAKLSASLDERMGDLRKLIEK